MADPVKVLCQNKTASGNATQTTVATVGATTNAAGNSLVATTVTGSTTNFCDSIADSSGTNVWERVGSTGVGNFDPDSFDVWLCRNPAALAATTGTVTAHYTGTGNHRELIVTEMSGAKSSVVSTDINRTATTTPAAAKVQTTVATAIVMGLATYRSATAPTVAAPFTLWATQNQASGTLATLAIAVRQEAATILDGPAFTLPSSLASNLFTFDLFAALPRPVTEALTTSDAVTRLLALVRAPSEALTTSETPTRVVTTARATADTLTTSDGAACVVTLARAPAETLTTTDAVTRTMPAQVRASADAVTTSDIAARAVAVARATADAVTTTDAVGRGPESTARAAADTLTTADSAAGPVRYSGSASDTLTTSDAAGRVAALVQTAADALTTTSVGVATVSVARAAADTVPTVTDAATGVVSVHAVRAAADTLTTSDGATRIVALAVFAFDNLAGGGGGGGGSGGGGSGVGWMPTRTRQPAPARPTRHVGTPSRRQQRVIRRSRW